MEDFRQQEEYKLTLSKDEAAGIRVFRTVYGGLKEGFSFRQIIRELTRLHFEGVSVGVINHGKGTLKKIKDQLASTLREMVKDKMHEPLPCTGNLRPVSEVVDKMTRIHETGQMSLVITPLMNRVELLTYVHIDNYTINPKENKYIDMVAAMRMVGDLYYSKEQVENAAADGAYITSGVEEHLLEELELHDSGWVTFRWDAPHLVNLAEEKAREKVVPKIKEMLTTAQDIIKLFRYGKEYNNVFIHGGGCTSLSDPMLNPDQADADNEADCEALGESESVAVPTAAPFSPVLRSSLKYAAYGKIFSRNYLGNLSFYIVRLNEPQANDSEGKKKQHTFKVALTRITVEHVTTMAVLNEVYTALSKCQHGMSKVNQLPWEFFDRADHMVASLNDIAKYTSDAYGSGTLKKMMPGLLNAEIGGVPIQTESRRITKSSETLNLTERIEKGIQLGAEFAAAIVSEMGYRLIRDDLIKLMKSVFYNWEEEDLCALLKVANESGRTYGSLEELSVEFRTLKQRFQELNVSPSMSQANRWLKICLDKKLYSGAENIIHLALCCFVKSPAESIAECIGSRINQHGGKDRYSMSEKSLGDEVQVVVNGPQEFSTEATELIKQSVDKYFRRNSIGPRFYVRSKLKLVSETIRNTIRSGSHIDF